MKYIYGILLLLLAASCGDDVQKWDHWPEWKMFSPLSIAGEMLNEELYSGFQGKVIHLEKGQEVEFKEVDDIASILPGSYFEYISDTKARFKGNTDDYSLNYDPVSELLYIEKGGARYPEGVWLCGANLGHPQAGAVTTSGWSMEGANNVLYCYKEQEKVFQFTLYLANNFAFKFYKHRGWGEGDNEITTLAEDNITLTTPFLVAGKSNGDFVAGPLFQAGVYLVTLNLNTNTCTFEPKDENLQITSYYVNEQEMGVLAGVTTCLGISLQLRNGDEVAFRNFDDIRKMIQPDFFEGIFANKAKFTGADGNYNLFYDPVSKLIYVENKSAAYPDALWLCGANYGHAQASYVTAGSWTFDGPKDAFQCKKISDNVFETTLYLTSDFKFKLYKQRGWGNELTSIALDPLPVNWLSKGWKLNEATGGGNFTGDFSAGKDFTSGVYRVRIDLNNNVCAFVDKLDGEPLKRVSYKVNGLELTSQSAPAGFIAVEFDFTKGQYVNFEGFACLEYMLQPEYFVSESGRYKFNAPDGKYRILYSPDRELVYVEKPGAVHPETLWITGATFGHPKSSGLLPEDIGNWNWTNPKDYVCCVQTGNKIYETNMLLLSNFMFRFYFGKGDWDHQVTALDVETIPANYCGWVSAGVKSENFGPGPDFIPGIYHIKLDMNTKVCTFTRK